MGDTSPVTTRLWRIVEEHLDDNPYKQTSDVAREMGVSDQLLSKWRKRPVQPSREHMEALARVTGVSYWAVLRAALIDKGLLQDVDTAPAENSRHSV